MSMKVGSGMSQYYDVSRLNRNSEIEKTSRVDQSGSSAAIQNENRNASQYISQDHGGVVQTRVSDANSYQKSQLDGSREKVEKLADKLMSKLPNILADMQNLPAADETGAVNRVAVNERNAGAVAERQQQEAVLQNFAL